MSEKDDVFVVNNLKKQYNPLDKRGKSKTVFEGLNLTQQRGSFVSIVGTSGCGKSTLLRIIGGLSKATSGEVLLNNHKVIEPPKELVLVFQDYNNSLLPWRNIEQNIRLGLEARYIPEKDQKSRVDKYLEMVGLSSTKTHYPWELSGGMQQRVAVARALACEPEILLIDEPFGSLDAVTKGNLEDELLSLWSMLGMSIFLVTHDIDEAIYLSDRVLVLSGSPAKIKKDITIDLPRPRDQIATRSAPEFAELRTSIFKALRDKAINL